MIRQAARPARRALSSQPAAAAAASANGQWVPRAERDTLYTIERRRWRKETSALRVEFMKEHSAKKAAKAQAAAEEAEVVAARRQERIRRRRELAVFRQQEMAEELRQIQEAKAARKELNRQHKARAEELERAKSIFAVETLEEEKHRWIASEEDLTPDRMLSTSTPPGFTRPKFRVLYGDWELPWEMRVPDDKLPASRPASRVDPDQKKQPIPPVAAPPVDGVNDMAVPDALEAIAEHYREVHAHMAAKGAMASRSRVKLERDRTDELAAERIAAERAEISDFIAFSESNPFDEASELERAIDAAKAEGEGASEWDAAR